MHARSTRCPGKSPTSPLPFRARRAPSSPDRRTGTYSSSPERLPVIVCPPCRSPDDMEGRNATGSEPAPTANPGERPVLLVADDDQDIRALFRAALEREGFTVLLASNGRRAMQLVRSAPVSVMLLDLNMP